MQFEQRDSGLVVPVEKREQSLPRIDLPETKLDAVIGGPSSAPPWHVVHYHDLDASVRYRMVNTHVVEFDAREWFGILEEGKIYYRDQDDQPTEDFEAAWPVMVSGNVKWDGCSNLSFHTEDITRHVCGFDGLRKFTALLETIYCDAARLLDSAGVWHDGKLPSLNR